MSANKELIENLFKANRRSVARSISIVENDNSDSSALLKKIHSNIGQAYRIGITGPPGAGKSTITNQLTKHYRKLNKKVGIIAVDPTSPFTGGALLGDRIRMNEIGIDEGVFIRSMATRGSLGGLSKKAIDASDVLDAAGFDLIILETVGVGQSELDIAQAADTTIVVLVPESGDSVQAMKAGLMEIADFFVLNKSDRPGSEQAIASLQTILMMKDHDEKTWMPKIIKTIASENKGILEIAGEIERHKTFMNENNFFIQKRESQTKIRIKEIVESKIRKQIWSESGEKFLNSSLEKVVLGDLSPYYIAEEIILDFINRNN
ncbi:MAG: methylmalonyl Co-A mutase-associated GTPase MeaB [Ignavibacteria bacterium]|nr:methylmalonyl Co-A mutase-associated GTPase MeaB [Ignavibacteria bacterium]MBT8383066.1 methylmalonyl Co-A mutase-associated GTPase MeaB [Ignavibacteria bacterium]MBT8392395.1 methylmalonyl Co-A mutase-associated GTPase MeaB [Ignavibacteria bacterium]NNJ52660.1 methylmalonyl Co-A mutase-associated GTPase MeaB [Ignavibacteriaceae bacterium]NNL22181.1 methylmalonyl Co-A mutase-associated GTPase MeaB [Ignavibacteriaceae bacterium]